MRERRWLLGSPDRSRFPAQLSALAPIRELIRRLAARDGVDPTARDDMVLAVSEAATNAILHSGSDVLQVRWSARRGCVRVRVRDGGVFRRDVAAPGDSGGRGIPAMMAMMDEVAIREGTPRHPGTVVSLVRCGRR
jgi:anti-sigma regulatory factor (Ser/Thr protein kinase)